MKAKFENLIKTIEKKDILPGDIIISVGTIDPKLTEDFLIKSFDEYNLGSYKRLQPLFKPVKLGQSLFSHTTSGHNDSIHTGVCLGLDKNSNPVITDLHGRVQDIPVDKFYIPNTLRVFRPHLSPLLFEKAMKNLLKLACDEDKEEWKDRDDIDLHQLFIPGRLESKWNEGVLHLLQIGLSPSNFFAPPSQQVNRLGKKMICSKLVVEIYKILLLEIATHLNIEDKFYFIKNYMNLLDCSSPKTLEGYLTDNVNYSQFIVPTETKIFARLEDELSEENDSSLLKFYCDFKNDFLNSDLDQYNKALIFINNAAKCGIKLPKKLEILLASQGIIRDEVDKTKGSHHALEKQYREGKKAFKYIIDSDSPDLKQVKQQTKEKYDHYESLRLFHDKNRGLVDKTLGYEAKTLLTSGLALAALSYLWWAINTEIKPTSTCYSHDINSPS